MAAGRRGLTSPAETAARLRNQARRAAAELAAYEAAQVGDERFGTYRLGPDEDLDESEVLDFLQRARREQPEQEITIAVTARTVAAHTPSPNRAQRKEQHQ